MLPHMLHVLPVHIQSLSELERARLQQVALWHLEQRELPFSISIPKGTRKRRKSIRRKFDSFSKEKKDRDMAPRVFSLPLAAVILHDRAHRRRLDELKESRRDCLELEASVLSFRAQKRLHLGPASPNAVAPAPVWDFGSRAQCDHRGQRRGGLSVDSISDLVESQSRLLEALQLSHPAELELKKSSRERTPTNKLSLNPICRQVPRLVESCCHCMETHGLQTVGIFRVGSSKKRVRQLREDFDLGLDVQLDQEQSVHDVAALLKEFLRDMPDTLLPRELYHAFLHANLLHGSEQQDYLQLLLYLLPPCNCDTLLRLLLMLHTVQSHAHDTEGPNGEQVSGNKMTAPNLAVIFGPNLLQKEKSSECPLSLNIEDSGAIINVTLLLIQHHRKLFMVSSELQQEVLMSLLQTDPDIVDYLLKRKRSAPVSASSSRRDTGASLDSVGGASLDSVGGASLDSVGGASLDSVGGASLDSVALAAPSPLTADELLDVLKQRSRHQRRTGDVSARRSIFHLRQFHSHHNLLSLVPSSPTSPSSPCAVGEQGEQGVWVKQSPQDPLSHSDFWGFFSGKVSGSETVV
ncbi:unnamed protein product [Knipowitschia caucasica]